jgi:hypothetical protein
MQVTVVEAQMRRGGRANVGASTVIMKAKIVGGSMSWRAFYCQFQAVVNYSVGQP